MSSTTARRLAAREVVGIAGGPGTVEQRGTAMLDVLGTVVPFDAAWFAARDPERDRHSPVAARGAAEPLRRFFLSDAGEREIDLVGLDSRRGAMRAKETPVPLGELVAWTDYLWPAGFRDGLAIGFFSAPTRYVGFLALT